MSAPDEREPAQTPAEQRAAFEAALDAADHGFCTCLDDDRYAECIYAQERAAVLAIFDAIRAERDDLKVSLALSVGDALQAKANTAEMVLEETDALRQYNDALARKFADAEEQRDSAKAVASALRHEPNLSGEAIMEARAYLKEHLGVECAFFDDCIHNAVAMCLQAREKLADAQAGNQPEAWNLASDLNRDLRVEAATLRVQVERLREILAGHAHCGAERDATTGIETPYCLECQADMPNHEPGCAWRAALAVTEPTP